MIRYYTREAGVRELERQITRVCRKIVREISEGKAEAPVEVAAASLEHYLGVRKYNYGLADLENQVGRVTGLAWTSVGGELLSIEAAIMPGKARLVKTGSLGEVMQESIQAALTVVRSRCTALGIDPELFEKKDIHIHVPEGATPKDGPSAGISMCTALVSAFTGIPIRSEVAMTGEINLRGEVMQIGGLKEKLLAARRGGIKTVLIPQDNERDLKEIPESIKGPLQILPVQWIDQVLEVALTELPEPLPAQSLSTSEDKTADLRPGTH
jgi:ATP-dependent Lon protease